MKRTFAWCLLVIVISGGAAYGAETENRTVQKRSPGHTVLPPIQSEQYEYTELCGCCEEDLQCEMVEKAITWKDGKKYDSVTSWKLKWDYAYNREAGGCFADGFRVNIEVLFKLPKWVCDQPVPSALTQKWNRYISTLTEHENGHRDLALKAAGDLTRAVAEMPPAATCAELDRTINTMCREHMKKLDEQQSLYDAATDHGHSQGLVFP